MGSLWDRIVGHDEVVSHLRRDASDPSHAYLFVGPRGVGKATIAKVFAAAVNCERLGCGTCPSCRKVEHGVHPDVHFLEPAGKSEYLIGQIVRRPTSTDAVVIEEANRTPFEGKRKVFVFEEAERLGEDSANALLKTLEEPPGGSVFILVTERLEELLPTVVSRCGVVRFNGIAPGKVLDFLVGEGNSREDAELAAKLSGGVPGEARSFLASRASRLRRDAVLSVARKLPYASIGEVSFMAEELLEQARSGVDELKERQNEEIQRAVDLAATPPLASQVRKRLEEAHKRVVSKEEQRGFEMILGDLASWYRDALLISTGAERGLVNNLDRAAELEFQAETPVGRLMACLEAIIAVRKQAAFNVNMQMALEAVLFTLQKELASCPLS